MSQVWSWVAAAGWLVGWAFLIAMTIGTVYYLFCLTRPAARGLGELDGPPQQWRGTERWCHREGCVAPWGGLPCVHCNGGRTGRDRR